MRDQRTTPLIYSFFSQLLRTESEQTRLTVGWMVKFNQINIFAGTSDTELFFPLDEALRILVPSLFSCPFKENPALFPCL